MESKAVTGNFFYHDRKKFLSLSEKPTHFFKCLVYNLSIAIGAVKVASLIWIQPHLTNKMTTACGQKLNFV